MSRPCRHDESLYGRCVACGMTWEEQAAQTRLSTHNVYRIDGNHSYQETPCFCPASQAHLVGDESPRPLFRDGDPEGDQ